VKQKGEQNMGTQQLLLIVLGVIIVGVAIAVGITIFNNQAYNANANALASEAANYAATVLQYWKTPESQGGAGRNMANMGSTDIGAFVGFSNDGEATDDQTTTDNGTFAVVGSTTDGANITIYGLGTEKKGANFPLVTTTITLDPGTVASTITGAEAIPTTP
jgi:hypothetical protein